MQGGIASLIAAMAWLLFPGAAAACELLQGKVEVSPLETRKPVRGDDVRLVSGFGMRFHPLLNERRMHTGVDWAAAPGTPVLAASPGRVVSTTGSVELGNTVLIDHGAGWQTLYGHLASFDVREADCVKSGTVIGKVGSTGLAGGPRVHFEVRRNGQPIDPMGLPVKSRADEIEGK